MQKNAKRRKYTQRIKSAFKKTRSKELYSLQKRFTWGKYKGRSVEAVAGDDPSYIIWFFDYYSDIVKPDTTLKDRIDRLTEYVFNIRLQKELDDVKGFMDQFID